MPQLIGPIDLIYTSWDNLKKNVRLYGELIVWLVAISVFQWTLLVFVNYILPNQGINTLLFYVLISVPGSLAFLAITGAMINLTISTVSNKQPNVKESIIVGFKKLLPLLIVSTLVSIATFFGLFLFIIPGIIIMIWYKFALYEVVGNNKSSFNAMKDSRNLVTGRWFPVAIRIAVPTVYYLIFAYCVTFITYALIGGVAGDFFMFIGQAVDMTTMSKTHTLITTLVPQTINGFTLALILSADVALWLDLQHKG